MGSSNNINVQAGLDRYDHELREYVTNNQKLAYDSGNEAETPSGEAATAGENAVPDFGLAVIPFTLKNY